MLKLWLTPKWYHQETAVFSTFCIETIQYDKVEVITALEETRAVPRIQQGFLLRWELGG